MGTAINQSRVSPSSSRGQQARQPRGVTTGGQFAKFENAESTVDLSIDEGVAATERFAHAFIRRYGLSNRQVDGYMDEDDMTQDAVLAYLMAIPAEDEVAVAGAAPTDIPIGVIAKRSIIRALSQTSHTSSSSSTRSHATKKLLDTERSVRESRMGRRLDDDEYNSLADEVRMALPPKERPSKGYHLANRISRVSLDGTSEKSGEDTVSRSDRALFMASVDEPEIDSREFFEGSIGDLATQLKDDGQQVKARSLAWDAIAESHGAPFASATKVSKRAIVQARNDVAQAGGALACATSYIQSGETCDSLFVPYGALNDQQKRAVCVVLRLYPDYADDLWRVASSQAEGRGVKVER